MFFYIRFGERSVVGKTTYHPEWWFNGDESEGKFAKKTP